MPVPVHLFLSYTGQGLYKLIGWVPFGHSPCLVRFGGLFITRSITSHDAESACAKCEHPTRTRGGFDGRF
ncbi:MAG TPA: hypothetical protein DCE42_10825 [Myxococcales bacterium]|nr:hypothetical protein [Deltaproteobacteria bacterium]HAA55240.1 hypothetical protein [Myxococcales bacterium]